MLTGITLIRDGNKLGYPWKECIKNLSKVCDRVLVNLGDSSDDTVADFRKMAFEKNNVVGIHFKWDMKNTGDGGELAKQANNLLPYIEKGWVLYLQADELVHPNAKNAILVATTDLHDNVSQLELLRTYFWGSLTKRVPEKEIWLGRVFRIGTHKIGGDGMFLLRESGEVARTNEIIFHYSRMGTEEECTQRLRVLDSLFHDRNYVEKQPPFSYSEVSDDELEDYHGPHPEGIEEFYA